MVRKEEVNRPIKKFKIGLIEAAVWANKREFDGKEVEFKTVTLSRSYKKKDEDVWKSEIINNIRRNDVPKIMAIMGKLQDYLYFEVQQNE